VNNAEIPFKTVYIPGKPFGKQRPRGRKMGKGVQLYTPEKTVTEEAYVRAVVVQKVGSPFLLGPVEVRLMILVPIPKSWSAKKRIEALATPDSYKWLSGVRVGKVLPVGKPDLDNVAKLVLDALNGILWRDDSQVVSLTIIKQYASEPGMQLNFREVT
jgi:Holliday junction resolvase RusA-like endonuclease